MFGFNKRWRLWFYCLSTKKELAVAIEPFIKCSNIKQSLAFYTQILDFSVVVAPDPDPEAFMSMYAYLEREGSGVHLSQHAGDGVFGNVIYVRVADITPLYQKFVANGLNTDNPEQLPAVTIKPVLQTWGMHEFAVADPDGNRITFGQRAE